jgi:Family of unknown function (DUF6186)
MSARTATFAGWFVLIAAVVALEIRARVRPGRYATLADTVAALVRVPFLRGLALAGWLWLGWHLFVR